MVLINAKFLSNVMSSTYTSKLDAEDVLSLGYQVISVNCVFRELSSLTPRSHPGRPVVLTWISKKKKKKKRLVQKKKALTLYWISKHVALEARLNKTRHHQGEVSQRNCRKTTSIATQSTVL